MDKTQATTLANALADEAESEMVEHIYLPSQSANNPDVWCVLEMDRMRHNTPVLQVWISPEISFPLA